MQKHCDHSSDFIVTPHGLRHRTCVHQVDERTDIRTLPKCQQPPTNLQALDQTGPAGWLESATFTPSVPLSFLSVRFTVPEPPAKSGSLVYLFPGMEDARLTTILQPVLQWGCNHAFGGDYWTIASWHCTTTGASHYSAPQEVFPGETIVGTVKILDLSPESALWIVETSVAERPEVATRLEVPDLKKLMLFVVAGALEAYVLDTSLNLSGDSALLPQSGSTVFTDIELRDLSENCFRADWNAWTPGSCGFTVDISEDRGTVVLNY